MTPGTSALVSTSIVRRGVTSTVNSPMRVMRGLAPGAATAATVISSPSLRTVTCSRYGWSSATVGATASAMPRDSACARALTTLSRVPSTTPSTTPIAARGQEQRVGVHELAPEAQRELLDGARAAIGEQRASHRGRAACEQQRVAKLVPVHALAADDVERARQLAAEQRVAHAGAHVDRHVALSLGGRCAEVRREHDARRGAQRMVGGERLLGEDVEQRAAQAIARQLGDEIRLVDDAAASEVRDDRAVAQQGELASANHPARLVVERRVNRDDVGGLEQRVELVDARHLEPLEAIRGDVRIVSEQRHPERARARGDLAADATESDDAERAATQLGAEQRAAVPAPAAHRSEGVGQMAHERDERSEKQLGDGDCISGRRVDDGDAERGGRGDVDVVGADAGATDDLEATRAAKQFGGDLRRAAADDGVVVADDVEQVAPRRGRAFVDVKPVLGAEQFDALGIDFVGHQDIEASHRRERRSARGRQAAERNVRGIASDLQIFSRQHLYF